MGQVLMAGIVPPLTVPVAGIPLSDFPEGQVVMIPEDGVLTPFYLAKHDYESGLNGAGRVLMVRKESYGSRQWHTSNVNTYSSSAIDTWLNGDYKSLLDAEVQNAIGTTKFYCSAGGSNVTTVSTLTRSVFLLSATELGENPPMYHIQGSKLPIASTLNVLGTQWTRTRVYENTTGAYRMSNGSIVGYNVTTSYDIHPAFTLPNTALVSSPNADGSINLMY